jgi:hypothetical protein
VTSKAMPITRPGTASGASSNNSIAALPRQRERCSASAAATPAGVARPVANSASTALVIAPLTNDGSFSACQYQWSDNARGGKLCTASALNETSTRQINGASMNAYSAQARASKPPL